MLEAVDCCGEIKSLVLFVGYKCPFSLEFTEVISSYGCFSKPLSMTGLMGISTSLYADTDREFPVFTIPYWWQNNAISIWMMNTGNSVYKTYLGGLLNQRTMQ